VRLQELRGGRRLVVELLDVAVSLWVVVVRVDHDLARRGSTRDLPVVLERDGDHNDVPSFLRRRQPPPRAHSVRVRQTSADRVFRPRELPITTL